MLQGQENSKPHDLQQAALKAAYMQGPICLHPTCLQMLAKAVFAIIGVIAWQHLRLTVGTHIMCVLQPAARQSDASVYSQHWSSLLMHSALWNTCAGMDGNAGSAGCNGGSGGGGDGGGGGGGDGGDGLGGGGFGGDGLGGGGLGGGGLGGGGVGGKGGGGRGGYRGGG